MNLRDILKKDHKTFDDAQHIYELIRKFKFFEAFFSQNMRTMDLDSMITLCQGFRYEQFSQGAFVFEKDDPSNHKFYVILSGEVGVIIPRKHQKRNNITHKAATTIAISKQPTEEKKPMIQSKNNSIEILDEETLSPWSEDGDSPMNEASSVVIPHRKLELKSLTQPNLHIPLGKEKLAEVKLEKIHEENKQEGVDIAPEAFEQYSKQFGKYARTLEQGDGFGELALKNNSARSASILCKTACEFLVMTKRQFDAIFLKKEREKEDFLRAMFPFINDESQFSDINFLLYSFKTEVFSRGNYLTHEGKLYDVDAKLYLIYQGECRVEKNHSIEVSNPHEKSEKGRPSIANSSIHITVVGKGTIVGEEILVNGNEYNYSVKVLFVVLREYVDNFKATSDTVAVYSILKRDFEGKFFIPFWQHVISLYEKKKRQREVLFESLRKDHEERMEQQTTDREYYKKDVSLNHLINKASIQSLNRQVNKQISEQKDLPPTLQLIQAKKLALKHENSSPTLRRLPFEMEMAAKKAVARNPNLKPEDKKKVMKIAVEASTDPRMSNMEQRFNFLSRVPPIQKPAQQDLESLRFFNDSPTSKIRIQKAPRLSHKSQEPTVNISAPQSPRLEPVKKERKESVDQFMKAYVKVSKKYKEQNHNLLDIRGLQKLEDFHFDDEHFFPVGSAAASTQNNPSPTLHPQKDPSLSPLSNRRRIEARKSSINISPSPLLPSYKSTFRNERDSPVSMYKGQSIQDSGVLTSMGGSDFKLKSLGPEDFKIRLQNRKGSVGASPRRVAVPQLMLRNSSMANIEEEHSQVSPVVKPRGLHTPLVKTLGILSPSSEVGTMMSNTGSGSVSKKALNLNIKLGLTGSTNNNNASVQQVSDWRKRVFQRTSRDGISTRREVNTGSTSISPQKQIDILYKNL